MKYDIEEAASDLELLLSLPVQACSPTETIKLYLSQAFNHGHIKGLEQALHRAEGVLDRCRGERILKS